MALAHGEHYIKISGKFAGKIAENLIYNLQRCQAGDYL
jgi:hypothetical protein